MASISQNTLTDGLQLAPLLDDASSSLFDQSLFDPFSVDLPPLQDFFQAKSTNTIDTIQPGLVSPTSLQVPDVHPRAGRKPSFNNGKDRPVAVQKEKTKTSVPLAEVLNTDNTSSSSTATTVRPSQLSREPPPSPRKKRKVHHHPEWPLHLPHPRTPQVTSDQRFQPMIPPLLQGLHEPPPNAAWFPPIVGSADQPFPKVGARGSQPSLQEILRGHGNAHARSPGRAGRERRDDDGEAAVAVAQDQQHVSAPTTDTTPPAPTPHDPKTGSRRRRQQPSRSSRPPSSRHNKPLHIHTFSPSPSLPSRSPTPPSTIPQSTRSLSAHDRNPWTESETASLLLGIEKFGLGRWKEMSQCEELGFQRNDQGRGRTAVDLKDRWRVLWRNKDGGSKARASRKSQSASAPGTEKESAKSHRPKKALPAPPPVKPAQEKPTTAPTRRSRTRFTAAEDAALLRGFEQHGALWAQIRSSEGSLEERTPRDLRDRVRNRWPERFWAGRGRRG